jgi:hypothetical protein
MGGATEIRLFPVKYQSTAHLTILTILKHTIAMFLATDPAVYMVSCISSNVIIRNTTDFDIYSTTQIQELFPAKIINGQANLRTFMASSMNMNHLKQSSYGLYEYTSPNVWVSDDLFESSNPNFILRKDPTQVDREILRKELYAMLSSFGLNEDDTQRLEAAREHLPFPACLPKFQVRHSKNISLRSPSGKVTTSTLTIYCDAPHVNVLNKLITQFCDETDR